MSYDTYKKSKFWESEKEINEWRNECQAEIWTPLTEAFGTLDYASDEYKRVLNEKDPEKAKYFLLPSWQDSFARMYREFEEISEERYPFPEYPGSYGGDWDPEFEETWYWEGDNYPATDVAYETYSYTDESGAYDWNNDDDIIYEDYSYP